MSNRLAQALVFFTSASVLVIEILAGRLLAPYVGVTLETFTGIIGVVLAGISIGAWMGGRIADRRESGPLLGPLLVAGGVFALVAPTVVHWVGPSMRAAGPVEIVAVTLLSFFLPAAVLSTVGPIVVKLRLESLEQTGTVVGSFSAVGTAGAIFGTFLTGFVLVAALPSDIAIGALGGLLVIAGVALWIPPRTPATLQMAIVPALIAFVLLAVVEGPCDEETTYFCAFVTVDDERPSGRILWLDTLRHSYVDLADPTHLEFRYARVMADVLSSMDPGPLDTVYIGGGGFTLPRYMAAIRPGSTSTVLEIDAALVDLVRRDLGLVDRDDIVIEIGDARVGLATLPAGLSDLVVGDAFGGLSVPWHLTTREFAAEIRARLTPGGVYLLNLIDYPPLGFARAEVGTVAEVFPHVIVIAPADYLAGRRGGNFVVAASDRPFNAAGIEASITARTGEEVVVAGDAVAAFVDGAAPLRDDFAPVDQLISRP